MIPVRILLNDGSLLTLPGKPVIGNEFRNRQFVLCSKVCIDDGLYSVLYMVIEARSGISMGHGESKSAAMAEARASLRSITTLQQEQVFAWQEARVAARLLELQRQAAAKAAEIEGPDRRKPISKTQRAQILEKSDGRCHYCEEELLEQWHVEHMTPRSRGGSDELDNLVASCPPCNIRKGTKTADEFKPAILALAKQMGVRT